MPCCIGSRRSSSRMIPNHKTRRATRPTMHDHADGAQRRKLRNVHGIGLLDKPVGITSNGALQNVKRLFQARKAGHTGSLDPLASGLLPLCFGAATKVSAFLLESDKH